MNELVKRLRSRGCTAIELEAADEIERLRQVNLVLDMTVERLTRERDEYHAKIQEICQRPNILKDEVDRLRAALEGVEHDSYLQYENKLELVRHLRDIAREALRGADETKDA